MPSPSLFLGSGATLFSVLSFFTAPSAGYVTSRQNTVYALNKEYSNHNGNSFFANGNWDFFTGADLTDGFVNYQSFSQASTGGLLPLGTSNSQQIKMDYSGTKNNPLPGVSDYNGASGNANDANAIYAKGEGRKSVRISTVETWQYGLFIADINNMPGGICGTWPAFWTLGDGTWPYTGEIDIIEGKNADTQDLTSLHTQFTPDQCSIDSPQSAVGATGTTKTTDCQLDGDNYTGCGVTNTDPNNYGIGFNNNGGGVYAMEWTPQYIQTWFFPHTAIPASLTKGAPTPSSDFGKPYAFLKGNCDYTQFKDQQMIFDLTFCGGFAGNNDWGNGQTCTTKTGYQTCAEYVAVAGDDYKNGNMYW